MLQVAIGGINYIAQPGMNGKQAASHNDFINVLMNSGFTGQFVSYDNTTNILVVSY